MAQPPEKRSSSRDIAQFLAKTKTLGQFLDNQPRLIFAIDATASRQPTWDQACALQSAMFEATAELPSLAVQLCYYRGFKRFHSTDWISDTTVLRSHMNGVLCEGGHTQLARVLRHAMGEHRQRPVRALVFIGDALEESVDTLCDLAGQCGLLKLPLFLFQEGADSAVESAFRQITRLSGGAYARFDHHSRDRLAQLLGAVASYAAGGHPALASRNNDSARMLLRQLKS